MLVSKIAGPADPSTRVSKSLWLAIASVQLIGWLPLMIAITWKLLIKLWSTRWRFLWLCLVLGSTSMALALTYMQAEEIESCAFGFGGFGCFTWIGHVGVYTAFAWVMLMKFWWILCILVAVLSIIFFWVDSGSWNNWKAAAPSPNGYRNERSMASMTSPSRVKSLLIGVVALAAFWCWLYFYVPNYKPAVMKTFSTQLKTHCVGRYLIDLPEDMGDPSVLSAEFYYGLDKEFKTIEASMPQGEGMEFDDFRRRVTERLNELRSQKNSHVDRPMLQHSEVVSTPNGDAVLLRRFRSESSDPISLYSEVHAYVNGRYIRLEGKSYPPEDKMLGSEKGTYKYVDPQPTEERLKHMVRNLKAAKDVQRAPEGFCMNGIVFDAQRIGYDEEKADFSFRDGASQDRIWFEIQMNGRTGQGKMTLLEQVEQEDEIYRKIADPGVTLTTIRRGERQIAGMRFQEDGTQLYFKKFSSAQYRMNARNVQEKSELSWRRPAITVQLESGEFATDKSHSPLSRMQVEQAWDEWLRTLRLAPVNGGPQR
jgi:hypothetical protein